MATENAVKMLNDIEVAANAADAAFKRLADTISISFAAIIGVSTNVIKRIDTVVEETQKANVTVVEETQKVNAAIVKNDEESAEKRKKINLDRLKEFKKQADDWINNALKKELVAGYIKHTETFIKTAQTIATRWETIVAAHRRNNQIEMASITEEYRRRIADERAKANTDNAEIIRLEKERDEKLSELRKEQAKREKRYNLFKATIDNAAAIVATLKTGGLLGLALAGAVAGLGIAQIAVIASTPEPFAAGALIRGGRGGVHGLIGEGQENELILPMETGVEKLAAELNKRQLSHSPAGNNTVNVNVGTLIADDRGIKELERRMRQYRIAEDKRTGVNV